MDDRVTQMQDLVKLLQADEESIPFIIGYLSPHLPTECMAGAVAAYERHLTALSTTMKAMHLAAANEQIAQE